jgi:hypothetical protein
MLDVGGKIGHYAPDHAQAMGQMVANTANYLNSLRPTPIQLSPLDEPFEPPFQKERFNDALDIAQQPLMVLQQIKDGLLLPSHIIDLKTMYPSLYASISKQLTSDMIGHISKGETIPYRLQISLSQFLGSPLDSTISQPSIMAAQMAQNRTSSAQQAQNQPAPKGKSLKSLDKMSQGYATSSQAGEMRRQSAKV